MRNLLPLLLLTSITDGLFAQTETDTYKTVTKKFESFYNSEDYSSIFALFSADMQKALPLSKTIEFFTGLQAQAGKITKRRFVKYGQTYAIYKTNFERILFSVNIAVDSDAKINGLLVKPFTDESLPKIERNLTKMQLPLKVNGRSFGAVILKN